jgi:hypothetical protein
MPSIRNPPGGDSHIEPYQVPQSAATHSDMSLYNLFLQTGIRTSGSPLPTSSVPLLRSRSPRSPAKSGQILRISNNGGARGKTGCWRRGSPFPLIFWIIASANCVKATFWRHKIRTHSCWENMALRSPKQSFGAKGIAEKQWNSRRPLACSDALHLSIPLPCGMLR